MTEIYLKEYVTIKNKERTGKENEERHYKNGLTCVI